MISVFFIKLTCTLYFRMIAVNSVIRIIIYLLPDDDPDDPREEEPEDDPDEYEDDPDE